MLDFFHFLWYTYQKSDQLFIAWTKSVFLCYGKLLESTAQDIFAWQNAEGFLRAQYDSAWQALSETVFIFLLEKENAYEKDFDNGI